MPTHRCGPSLARSNDLPSPQPSEIGDEPASPSSGDGETDSSDSKKPKGHGRNGASAYRKAQRCDHALAPGVIGALCEKCKHTKMSRYRGRAETRIR